MSLDGAIFSGRGRDYHTTQYRVILDSTSKSLYQWAFDGIEIS